eukprot:14103005-Ditylum_brightwellii.AAC.1
MPGRAMIDRFVSNGIFWLENVRDMNVKGAVARIPMGQAAALRKKNAIHMRSAIAVWRGEALQQ